MIKKYFKCTLLSDIVINASLATEGNMTTLDYIPGSNFLGIVAGVLYCKESAETMDIFHSETVSFGNAYISVDNALSYPSPLSYFQDKLNNGIVKERTWVHHKIDKFPDGVQLKQHRNGYLNPSNTYIDKVKTEFSLKSAYDRDKRRSDDGKMFGFESMKKGQEFIFYIGFKNESNIQLVMDALIGRKRLGKSKSAQFGQVEIKKVDSVEIFESQESDSNTLVVYAESNLCFINDWGQSTFQPEAKDFGVEGEINWEKSQIRTYSYSPWNYKRNTTGTQRDCITKGSVIVIDKVINESDRKGIVGEYQAEGLGRVIFNPIFFKSDGNGVLEFELKKNVSLIKKVECDTTTALGKFLSKKKENIVKELKISEKVVDFTNGNAKEFEKISTSQWGGIRNIATRAKDYDDLYKKLFAEKTGFLTHGVAADKYWNKKILGILKEDFNENRETKYVAKLASEMAKLKQKQK